MSATQKLLRFGRFELNLEGEELCKDGIPLKLTPQPFKILALLASRAGQLVTREEIQKQVWGEGTYVDFDHGLNQCIKQIRSALNDKTDRPLYVETVPRRGYRFLASVVLKNVEAPAPRVTESKSDIQSAIALQSVPQAEDGALTSGPGASRDTARVLNRETACAIEPPISAPVAVAAALAPEPAPAPKPRRLMRSVVLLAVVIMSLAIAYGFYWRFQKVHALTEKDTIVLTDFTNTTGESVFDDTLKTALTVALNQSPFLNVLPDSKVTKTMKLMTRPAGTKLTPDVAHEVCQRTGSKAMVAGSIAELGSQYVIALNAVSCVTGDVLAEAQEQATNKEAVIKALDAAAATLRRELGESLNSVQKYTTPVEEATTPSLEALRAYGLGMKVRAVKGGTAALPFFKQAVELDSNFAMAYRELSVTYANLGELGRATENARKAYDLREKVSERERYSIEAFYYTYSTGELEKAAQVYELWQQFYPRDVVPYVNLGGIYSDLGNGEKALQEDREALRLEPNEQVTYLNLAGDLTNLNRFDEAEAVYKEAEDRKLEGESLFADRYGLAFVRGDTAEMAHLVSASVGVPGMEDQLLMMQANTEAWYGKLHNARELTRRAMDGAEHNDAKETAAVYQALAALTEAEAGNWERARAEANAAVKLAPNRNVQALAALALARAGDTAAAEELAAKLDRGFPLGTFVQKYWLPTVRAAVALQRKDPNRAVELLKVTSPVELGAQGFLLPVYLRGEAHLMLGDRKAAAGEFQKFIEHQGLVANFTWGALARLGVARAYALDAAKDPVARDRARKAYQDFLTLWKEADSDIPILKQTQAESAKLQ